MIRVDFPISITGKLEKEIFIWIYEYIAEGYNILDKTIYFEFEDCELALLFKLKFGI